MDDRPALASPSRSTNVHYRERTAKFVDAFGDLPLRAIGDDHIAAWLKGGRNRGTVQQLRIFFNDAASAEAGRLVDRNPFAKLRLRSSRGRRDIQPPGQAEIARFVTLADELMPPTFAAYLNTAVYEGMRPGELDALRWTGSTSRPAQSSSTSSGTRRPASSRRRNTAGYARSR
jgi:integrase